MGDVKEEHRLIPILRDGLEAKRAPGGHALVQRARDGIAVVHAVLASEPLRFLAGSSIFGRVGLRIHAYTRTDTVYTETEMKMRTRSREHTVPFYLPLYE